MVCSWGHTDQLPLLGDPNLGHFPPQQLKSQIFHIQKKSWRGGGRRQRQKRERERESRLRLEPAVCFWCVCVRASFRRTRAPVRSVPVGWPGGRCVGLRLRLRLRLALRHQFHSALCLPPRRHGLLRRLTLRAPLLPLPRLRLRRPRTARARNGNT